MRDVVIVSVIAATVVVFAVSEIVAAVLPVLIVVVLVPPADRAALAEVVAALDSSRRLRLWPALRLAVLARRRARRARGHDVPPADDGPPAGQSRSVVRDCRRPPGRGRQ
jgi:hypothetical protein